MNLSFMSLLCRFDGISREQSNFLRKRAKMICPDNKPKTPANITLAFPEFSKRLNDALGQANFMGRLVKL